jgi:hypothetical protein
MSIIEEKGPQSEWLDNWHFLDPGGGGGWACAWFQGWRW